MSVPEDGRATLRVVRGGDPTAEELAALVVALSSQRETKAEPTRRSAWADRTRLLRRPIPHGRDLWRHSL